MMNNGESPFLGEALPHANTDTVAQVSAVVPGVMGRRDFLKFGAAAVTTIAASAALSGCGERGIASNPEATITTPAALFARRWTGETGVGANFGLSFERGWESLKDLGASIMHAGKAVLNVGGYAVNLLNLKEIRPEDRPIAANLGESVEHLLAGALELGNTVVLFGHATANGAALALYDGSKWLIGDVLLGGNSADKRNPRTAYLEEMPGVKGKKQYHLVANGQRLIADTIAQGDMDPAELQQTTALIAQHAYDRIQRRITQAMPGYQARTLEAVLHPKVYEAYMKKPPAGWSLDMPHDVPHRLTRQEVHKDQRGRYVRYMQGKWQYVDAKGKFHVVPAEQVTHTRKEAANIGANGQVRITKAGVELVGSRMPGEKKNAYTVWRWQCREPAMMTLGTEPDGSVYWIDNGMFCHITKDGEFMVIDSTQMNDPESAFRSFPNDGLPLKWSQKV